MDKKKTIPPRPQQASRIPHLTYSGPYKKAVEIAQFYGFSLIEAPKITKDDLAYAQKLSDTESEAVAERIALIRHYDKENWEALSQPVCIVYTRKNGNKAKRKLHLAVLGTEKSVADMLILHLSWIILNEGTKKQEFEFALNTIGDKDSSAQFTRELSQYFRKHINTLPDDCRETFKQDIYKILQEEHEECLEFQSGAPRSMNFLSERSRAHFREVLEYLESASITYTIDEGLLPPKDAFSETAFAIRAADPGSKKDLPWAFGARSDSLTRAAGMRRTVPVAHSTIYYPTSGRESIKKTERSKTKQPSAFLIHLGDEARLRAFELLEVLRKAKLPVRVSFGREQMSEQVALAERLRVPKTLIIGQKEALEHAVIVRDMESRSQEIVDINKVVDFLKK